MAQIDTNGVTLEYDVRGEGEPLLMVMGLAGQLTDWSDGFVDLFVDRGFRVIRFDNRDIGLSTQTGWEPPSQLRLTLAYLFGRRLKGVGYTLTDMAADAVGLLDGLGIEAAHVLGVSMGGMIAQEMAIGHPGRVKSMCSIMSNVGDRRTGRIGTRLAFRMGRRKPPTGEEPLEELVQQVVDTVREISGPHFDAEHARAMAKRSLQRSFSPAGIARQSAAIAGSRDRTVLLGDVVVPTLVIHGLVDELVKPSGGIATADAVPGSRLLAFGDMGHDLPRPRWAEICAAVVDNTERAR